MSKFQQNCLGIALIIAIILGIVWQFFPLSDAEMRLESLPAKAPGIVSNDLPITPQEEEYFVDVNMLKRVYQVGDQRAFIYILDGTRNRHAVHDPTYCFRGSGWEIVGKEPFSLGKGGDATLYHLKKGDKTHEALLWFSDGKSRYASPLRYWWQTTLRRLSLGKSGPEPVLVVLQPIEKPVDWKKFLAEFPQLEQF